MKAVVAAFNQEKALVGAFSVIVQPVVEPMDPFAALVTIARAQGAVLRSPGPDIQSTDWRCPCQAVVLVVVAQAVVRRRQGDRVREGAVRYFGHLMVSRLLARVTRACTTLGTVLELEHAGNSRESVARHRATAPPCCLSSAHYPLPTSARLLQSLHHHCSDTGYLHPDIFRRYICRYLHKRLHASRKEDNQRY